MKNYRRIFTFMMACLMSLTVLFGQAAMASQDDNSLYALGITTEGVTVEPDFSYDTWEYTVTVPGGTTELSLDPVPSAEPARIADISGTQLDADGNGTVLITVEAGDGSRFTYTLHVVSDGIAPAETETEPPTEAPTEKQTEAPTEPETEDTRYVRVDRNTIEEAENTITSLKGEITEYRDTINLYTRIMFGLIALAVILLFLVINLLIRGKDLKSELKEYRSLGYATSKKEKKAEKKALKEAANAAAAQQAASKKAAKKAKKMPAYEQEAPSGNPGYVSARQQYAQQQQQYAQQPQARDSAPQQPAVQGQPQQAVQTAPKEGTVQVTPQQSQAQAARRSQQTAPQPQKAAEPAPQPQAQENAAAQKNAGRAAQAPKKDVQINMIDL